MAKFGRRYEITKRETEELLLDFSIALSEINQPQEAIAFVRDILSENEAKMLAKRLKIAELLLSDLPYSQIAWALKVSSGTIARVNQWLRIEGDGYRLLIERLRTKRKKVATLEEKRTWNYMKRKYPMYYWPQILLESVIDKASQQQRKQIKRAIRGLDHKSALYQRLNEVLWEFS